jgi:hypothetical protein
MIVDVRTYTAHPGVLPGYFAEYGAGPFAVQKRHLGEPLGYYGVEIGTLNTAIHIWGYKDIVERETRRAGLQADPDWKAWLANGAGRFAVQENRIMKPAPFYPIAGQPSGPYGVVDYRLYTTRHGKLPELLKIYGDIALPLQLKYLGNCIGWYQSDIGGLNQVLHLWGYKDAGDRQARRAAMAADPAWVDYVKASTPLIQRMENQLLVKAPFFAP